MEDKRLLRQNTWIDSLYSDCLTFSYKKEWKVWGIVTNDIKSVPSGLLANKKLRGKLISDK